ncbi:MAG: PAS domain-containing protein [Planctomycetota bacterium]|nr:MAG: PAS domain-containing protein [Planctomycetota bacterium]
MSETPHNPPDSSVPAEIHRLLHCEPGVGFAIVDGEGIVRFANPRSAELFLQAKPEAAVNQSLEQLFGKEWAEERMTVLRKVSATGKPAIIRHIRHGKQIQSTLRLLSEPGDEEVLYLVVTTEGEQDPAHPEAFEIVESKLAHLGPLDPLTRREMEVLALIGHGLSTKEIADTLHRSPRTVERHCDGLREKLQTANRVQLAEFARAAGLQVEDANLKRV